MRFLTRLVVLPLLATLALHAGPSLSDMETVTRQFREFYLNPGDPFAIRGTNEAVPDIGRALSSARSQKPDGSWDGIDYASKARSAWQPTSHTNRILAMAIAAEQPHVAPAERAELLGATHKAFRYWAAHDFQCTNWWYNKIGIPAILGEAGIVLGPDLLPEEKAYLVDLSLKRYPIDMTGQNRIWLSCNSLMRGILLKDPAIVETAATTVWREVAVTTEEGLQPDFSFHQHGPQQQMGNYGMGFAAEESRLSAILRGTVWAMPADRQELFRNYLLKGLAWVNWRGSWDVSACDRQMFPGSQSGKTQSFLGILALEAQADAPFRAAYEAAIARGKPGAPNDLVGETYFWRSDYYLHRAKDYGMSLKLSSNRVIGEECVNSENLEGYHAADGVLLTYRTGQEYEEIFPVWDWRRLPGVTCQVATLPAYKTSQVKTDFTGGLTQGDAGIAAIDYRRDGVTAHKAWFFGPFGVLCMGAGITAEPNLPVETTIEQRLLDGPVAATNLHGDANTVLYNGATDARLESPSTIEHAGWTITFLEPASVHLTMGPAVGTWRDVFQNPSSPVAPVTRKRLLIGIDHGKAPTNAHYAYAVGPERIPQAWDVANEPDVQAVRFADGRVEAVFWVAGASVPRQALSASAPCLVERDGEGLTVVDPTQKLAALELTSAGVTYHVAFPRGPLAGTPVRLPVAAPKS